jgi:hypothetical protein
VQMMRGLYGRAFWGGSTTTGWIEKKYPGAHEEGLGLPDTQFAVENVKDYPYVAGNDEYRGVIMDTPMLLYNLQMIKQTETGKSRLESSPIHLSRMRSYLLLEDGDSTAGILMK